MALELEMPGLQYQLCLLAMLSWAVKFSRDLISLVNNPFLIVLLRKFKRIYKGQYIYFILNPPFN